MMPGCSTSCANSSGVHLNDSLTGAGTSGITAYSLPPILKTKSSPHCICSVVCGSERQCALIQSRLISASNDAGLSRLDPLRVVLAHHLRRDGVRSHTCTACQVRGARHAFYRHRRLFGYRLELPTTDQQPD